MPSSNGKDPKTGKFLPGNKMGKGNPIAKKTQQFKQIICDAITEDDMLDIIAVLKDEAINKHNMDAIKVLLNRTAGPVKTYIDISTVDIQEQIALLDEAMGIPELIEKKVQESLEK